MIGARSSDLVLYRRVLAASRHYWLHLTAIIFLSLLATPVALLQPLPIQIVVDSVIGNRPTPSFLHPFLPSSAQTPSGLLIAACTILITAALLQQLEGFGSWLLQLYTGERLVLEFRARLFRHIQRLSLTYHDTQGTADSLYRIQNDASSVQYVIISGLIPLFTSLVMLAGMIVVIASIDWQLALVAVAVAPVLFLLTDIYRRRARNWWTRVREAESSAMAVVHETLSAVRVVKAFGQEDREESRFTGRLRHALRQQLKVVLAEATFGLSVALALGAGTATVLFIGVRHVQTDVISLGQLLLVVAYLAQLYKPLETISKKIASLQSSFAGAQRAFAVLDRAPDVPEAAHPVPLHRARGELVLADVHFAYAPDRDVLRCVNLRIAPGDRVGIAGPTGAGKTTLLSLLARFCDPTAGRILLDGVDLREYRLADLRNQFAIVLQDPVLFSCTIAENIAYGRPDASEADIVAATKAAHAHEFIGRLPNGYNSDIGERGMTLSGGERQRISLARAFLKNAPILLLDEPTSSVDTASEELILKALKRLMADRTTFMVAHRLRTLEICNVRLFVDGDGNVRQDFQPETLSTMEAST